MRTRRGSLLNGTTFGDAILMYKPGDVVKPVTVMDQFFTGVVRSVDTKTNKITVAWGGGPESQHDADEIMPMPFFGSAQKDGAGPKVSSCRRMKAADVADLLDAPEIGEEIVDSGPDSTDQTDFLADDMESLLNRQVGAEFYSAYLYYMVAAICQSKGLVGFQAWFESQGDGEIEHAMKVYKYLMDTGSRVELPAIPGPELSGEMDVAELTRAVLDHEMGVTQDWKRIGALAKEQDNPATCQLVQWFMTEQVEEEDAALTLHQRVQLADSGSGILLIDNDLKDRGPIAVTAQTAMNPPMGQFCGNPGTHGLDKPVGGGFSVMNDLAYELHDEANQFADVNPRFASLKAGLKEIASEASMTAGAEIEATRFIREATINRCPKCREMLDEDDSEWLGEDGAGIGWSLCRESCPKCGFEKTYKFSERGQMKDVRIKSQGRSVAATSGDEPPAQRTIEEETAKKSSVSVTARSPDLVDKIMRYEGGEMDQDETVEFFQDLIDSGTIHSLQGSYGRMAENLIRQGLCHRKGQAASDKTASDPYAGMKSRRAMYWCAPDRTFRLTQQEQQSGTATCPKCKVEMQVEPFTRSDKLMICPECRFKVPTSKAVKQVEVKVPAGVSVEVTQQDEAGNEVCGQNIPAASDCRRGRFLSSGQKYKGYTIEKSGMNFYVIDPSGHRAFGEVPATVEVAKKWIDQELHGKGKTGSDLRRGRLAYADPTALADLPRMSLSQIASLVYKDWKNVNFAAKPYLEAMSSLQNVSDMYFQDTGTSIVAYFLSNATSWRGDVAKAVKKELQRRIR